MSDIGTLNEGSLHAALKELYAQPGDQFEVPLDRFVIDIKRSGKTLAAYGAPAKGNTLLNYCGIGRDFIDYTVDRSPHKQGKLLPGTRIPIHAPERLAETRPDYVLILPWNIQREIIATAPDVKSWGGSFVVPIPEVQVLD